MHTVLIANRGAIARRIARSVRALGMRAVAVYTDADRESLHVRAADAALRIGEGPAASSYRDGAVILAAARAAGADAIHPGYGFLSENAGFAESCEAAGLRFIGPRPEQLRSFGLKHAARALAAAAGVPMLPGTGLLADLPAAQRAAQDIGYPVMLKSTAGGGGIGMRVCADADALAQAWDAVRHLALGHFADAGVFLERYVARARHVEVQIFGDGAGNVIALGDRDCSPQRRNQKVLEEAPAPGLPPALRARLHRCALALGRQVSYRSAGTVEFIYDAPRRAFYFLEVNTRLQVEHGVTEEVYGIDLVDWMLRLAAGTLPPLAELERALRPAGHAIQARLYAEDPQRDFQPQSGVLTAVHWPAASGLRVETWVESGTPVSPHYDPMLAKMIAHGGDRETARTRLLDGLAATQLRGIETNLGWLQAALGMPAYVGARPHTGMLAAVRHRPPTVEVLDGGTQTTLQDWPGRLGYWAVGVPPSGPMDALSFRLGNRALGNPGSAAGLELTLTGPSLRFGVAALVMLTGAPMEATLDGRPVAPWRPLRVRAGSVLALGAIAGAGARSYLLFAGGLDVPAYLGSRATFTLARFGGHGGRALRAGDVLHLCKPSGARRAPAHPVPQVVPVALRPALSTEHTLRVLHGPHGAPEFFTPADINTFYAQRYQVHYHADRTGVRLIGPKPAWARSDGGEAGLHPSNIHDNPYAIGAVDFTGDTPVILGPDGPSLGGFVCPATVIQADLWRLGQLKAGDGVRFLPVSHAHARALHRAQERAIAGLMPQPEPATRVSTARRTTLPTRSGTSTTQVCYRPQGDSHLLIELGAPVLDIAQRVQVHAWMQWLQRAEVPGVLDLTPGVRSLQVHYDPRRLRRRSLLDLLARARAAVAELPDVEVPCRVVHLPLSWDDPATRLAIQRYAQSVRADAPWCPSNIEFIRRINGLESEDAVRDIVHAARYLVLGLGDVYLGAPVATPLDPCHRLVTTKYNPARTWTPENAVGIGGAYLCVYGMEGPGGYQFVGRTLQMWNRDRQSADFAAGSPWLLRFFDQIRFYPVSAEELLELRANFPLGRHALRVEATTFSLRAYQQDLIARADAIAHFQTRQRGAFAAERARWAEQDQRASAVPTVEPAPQAERELPAGAQAVGSPVAGSVWQVPAAVGQAVAMGDTLVVVESMKTEIPLRAPRAGRVLEVRCTVGSAVAPGSPLVVLEPA